jgi:hypothetical protein
MSLLAEATTAATTADWITAWAAVATAAIALVATGVAFWQLPQIRKQLTLVAHANASQAYDVVAERMASLRNILADDDAALYPYFYESRDPSNVSYSKAALDLACEAIVDFADVCVEQRKSIAGADMDWSSWDAYFRHLYQHSPVLKAFLSENLDFYPDYVTTVFGYIRVRDELNGAVTSEWEVREADPQEVAGYPWIRTWVMTQISQRDGKGELKPVPETMINTLKAAVSPAGDASAVKVRFTWHVDDVKTKELEPFLFSWVLSQLESSSRLRTAEICVVGEKRRRRARLGSHTGRRRLWPVVTRNSPRERYLAQNVPFRLRR